jgi:hypothetical protein
MMRRIIPGLLILAVAVAGLVAQDKPAADQDDPPVRLKKKDRAKADPEEPARPKEEAKPDKEPPGKPPIEDKKPRPEERVQKPGEQPDKPEEPEVDEQEVINRALKSSRSAEERLANKETDDRTQQHQRDVLRELDSLIDLEKAAQQGQGQQQDQDQQNGEQQQQNQDKQNGKAQQQKGAMGKQGNRTRQQMAQGQQQGRRHGRRVARGNRQGQGSGQQQQGDGQDQQQANGQNNQGGAQGGRNGKNGGGMGGTSTTEENNLADVYKDVWGHLPEALRNEMSAYSREEFMAKYKDVLKQYYATIAEKGRKKN